ncbi:MAG: hypothetical protein GY699_18610 [Desulfobacteraceae bacterium]|nr:hypothetical protein [Desulfobacteraceae bacterium]
MICCRPAHCGELIRRLQDRSIAVAGIGRVLGAGTGVEAFYDSEPVQWKRFKVDEITRLF